MAWSLAPPCPAASAAACPFAASDAVICWNFWLPWWLKPSVTKALPSPACVPIWALIEPLLSSFPVTSGIEFEPRLGKYLNR
ncbi:MAG: hypothetical protein E6F97_02145 [Actinobacteria bacterium]|nr:MAG: hypothetical protein E6F97_02145 [Actinomycetota bacterium]